MSIVTLNFLCYVISIDTFIYRRKCNILVAKNVVGSFLNIYTRKYIQLKMEINPNKNEFMMNMIMT